MSEKLAPLLYDEKCDYCNKYRPIEIRIAGTKMCVCCVKMERTETQTLNKTVVDEIVRKIK